MIDPCPHESIHLAYRKSGNAYWWQCERCGVAVPWGEHAMATAVPHSLLTAEQKAAAVLWDDELTDSYWRQVARPALELQADEREKQRQEEETLRRAEWDEYMRSPQWQAKRAIVHARDNELCRICGDDATYGDVHHLTYRHARHEYLFELVLLCRPCHEEWHGR